MTFSRFLSAVTAAVMLICSAAFAPASASTVLRDVTIIDTRAETAEAATRPGQAVVIEQGRISWIGPVAQLAVPAGADVVDGAGKFVVPALWDMHAHLIGSTAQRRSTLLLMLANGVTNLRDMGTDVEEAEFARLREGLRTGAIVGPRIVASPLRITMGALDFDPGAADPLHPKIFFPSTPAEARELVAYVKAKRYDYIKPYDRMSRSVFFAMMAEANRLGVPVAGHIPMAVTIEEAAGAGIKSLEHARSLPWRCARAGDSIQRAYDAGTTGKAPPPDGRALQNDPAFLRATVAGFDAARCRRVLAEMKRHGMHYVPTHMTRRMDAFASIREIQDSPLLRFIDPEVRNGWSGDLRFYSDRSIEDRAAYMAFHSHSLMVTRLAHEAGVPILIGTDAPDTWVFPGFSQHQEMRELADAGIPPLDVLKSATLRAAAFLGVDRDFGSVTEGKVADLLVLSANPLADIDNTRAIAMVIKDGVPYDRARIAGLLAEAEAIISEQGGEAAATPHTLSHLH